MLLVYLKTSNQINSPLFDLMPEKKVTTEKTSNKMDNYNTKMEHDIHSEAVKQAS